MRSNLTGSDTHFKTPNDDRTEISQLKRRQTLRIAMAIFLIWIACTSKSDAAEFCLQSVVYGTQMQFDGFTSIPDIDQAIDDQSFVGPAYVQLYAELSNFDRDADPDGWHASVVIRSGGGSVVDVFGRATFEILEHSQRYGRQSTGGSLVGIRPLARWSVPLQFDDQGVAKVTLPASTALQRRLGWNSVATIHNGTRIAARHERHRWNRVRDDLNQRRFVSHNVRDRIDFPTSSWLRVRLMIPEQRSLEAVAPIDIRPAILVDMPQKYR